MIDKSNYLTGELFALNNFTTFAPHFAVRLYALSGRNYNVAACQSTQCLTGPTGWPQSDYYYE
jgi:hypothetical protein